MGKVKLVQKEHVYDEIRDVVHGVHDVVERKVAVDWHKLALLPESEFGTIEFDRNLVCFPQEFVHGAAQGDAQEFPIVVEDIHELFLDAFNWAKKKTDYLKEAELEMIIIEGRTYCRACGETYRTTEYGKKCPHCGSPETYLLTGDQVIIKDISAVFEQEETAE